jgi:hypothetical protein
LRKKAPIRAGVSSSAIPCHAPGVGARPEDVVESLEGAAAARVVSDAAIRGEPLLAMSLNDG